MPKVIQLPDVGDVQITKRRGQKSIRIAIKGSTVRVTQPNWLPYSAGEKFALSKRSWVLEHIKPKNPHKPGVVVAGKTILYQVADTAKLSIKVTDTHLICAVPNGNTWDDDETQTAITKHVDKLLRAQAEDYLPSRVRQLADMFGFEYKSVQVRKLRSRWGSCSSKKELVFNLRLMLLDTLHIDYVILHELTHTIHMHHGPKFWQHLESVYPGAKQIAKVVRRYQV